ncbi:MAG TPA: dihydrofolate reductase family protein [Polyangiaceae bacterium]|jgi:riboflavin biosynthesis pyrimidine reductase
MSARTLDDIAPNGHPLELLFEQRELPKFELPSALTELYSGTLGFASPRVFANFVASLDGVVALPGEIESGQIISGKNAADRFVMGLLRACADVVLIGAGTFRKSPGHLWFPERIYPPGAALFAEARHRLGLHERPRLALVSRSGDIEVSEPALKDALIFTTRAGEERLRAHLPASTSLIAFEADRVYLSRVLEYLHEQGLKRVLCEGGPSLFAELVAAGLLDELFLTSAPAMFGRFREDQRKSLASGLDLSGTSFELLSARRHGSHLFLRYAQQKSSTR